LIHYKTALTITFIDIMC